MEKGETNLTKKKNWLLVIGANRYTPIPYQQLTIIQFPILTKKGCSVFTKQPLN